MTRKKDNDSTIQLGTDIMDLYLHDLRQYPPTPVKAGEFQLFLAGRKDSPAVRQELALGSTALAFDRTKPFWERARTLGLDPMDLVGEANIQLARTARKYNPAFGTAFSTFATSCIDPWLKHVILGRESRRRDTVSLDEPMNDSDTPRLEIHHSDDNRDPEEIFLDQEQAETIRAALDRLPPKQMWAIQLRYTFDDRLKPKETDGLCPLEDVGKKMGYTRERIRQFEDKALLALRQDFRLRRSL